MREIGEAAGVSRLEAAIALGELLRRFSHLELAAPDW
jgi:cytochrome P450